VIIVFKRIMSENRYKSKVRVWHFRSIAVFCFLAALCERGYATDRWGGVYPQVLPLEKAAAEACSVSLDGWGYNYSDLEVDLAQWGNSPYVTIDSIGSSVQGRIIWMLTISSPSPSVIKRTASTRNVQEDKYRVFIHSRTHPREVQSTWVVNEIIGFLLDTGDVANQIRDKFIFNIVPMYNPDGVELGCPRENVNGVDLESAFNTDPPEPEVQALKSRMLEFMNSSSLIRVALNLHSSVNLCSRFFYFHHENGTSPEFADLEREYIGLVQSYFPGGIESWDFMQSWTDYTRTVYPESFFWLNYGENVMALTYEDINDQDPNCPQADKFDSTARALILGAVDYIYNHPLLPIVSIMNFKVSKPILYKSFEGGVEIISEEKLLDWRLSSLKGEWIDKGKVQGKKIFWNEPLTGPQLYLLSINTLSGKSLLITVILQ
jgi:hypothetical protein